MKAITIWQPYASLIANGHKQYETRSWATAFRGVLAIHSAKKWDIALQQETETIAGRFPELNGYATQELPRGCVIAAVELVAIYRAEDIRDSLSELERSVGNFATGRYAWEMKVIKLPDEPIPAKGQQGLWNWEYQRD
jgi:hypothetical protein